MWLEKMCFLQIKAPTYLVQLSFIGEIILLQLENIFGEHFVKQFHLLLSYFSHFFPSLFLSSLDTSLVHLLMVTPLSPTPMCARPGSGDRAYAVDVSLHVGQGVKSTMARLGPTRA
ncbi:hypothetical protein BDA96_10G354800 [Sorghum bicolor]|uniref:Uncharacterized protein n=2 Tax=Sorghum bicolor TaxID=4558 RepID=A0A921Q749_SORBI|nr:hypothetical protein BDA96_10G354800 [Sorghum bicolor]OQU77172.1 hypothetical protein SORBI_3010G276301 [Sorghum bicolor]